MSFYLWDWILSKTTRAEFDSNDVSTCRGIRSLNLNGKKIRLVFFNLNYLEFIAHNGECKMRFNAYLHGVGPRFYLIFPVNSLGIIFALGLYLDTSDSTISLSPGFNGLIHAFKSLLVAIFSL